MSGLPLQQAMVEAGVACCLRWPSFEASSAATSEALFYGNAIVATWPVFAMVKTLGEILGGWQASPTVPTADEIAEPQALFQTISGFPSPESIP